MNIKLIGSILFFLLINHPIKSQTSQVRYPITKKVKQEDNYHGTIIQDPYRWLENDTAADVKAWVENENKTTFDYLNKIPYRS